MVAAVLSRVSATALALLALAAPASAAAPERVPGKLAFTTEAGTFHATRAITRTLFATDDPDGRRLAVWSERDGRGVTALHVKVVGSGGDPVTSTEIGFRARPGRALPRLRRALQRASDQRGGEVESYVAEGPYEDATTAGRSRRSCRRGASTRAPTPPTSRSRGCSRPRGYGVLVDNDRDEPLPARPGRLGRLERRGRGAAARPARLRRPAPRATCCAASARASAASRAAAAPFFFGPWYQPRRRRARRPRRAAGERDAPLLGRADLHALPAVRDAGRPRGRRARARASASTTPGSRSPPTSTR